MATFIVDGKELYFNDGDTIVVSVGKNKSMYNLNIYSGTNPEEAVREYRNFQLLPGLKKRIAVCNREGNMRLPRNKYQSVNKH